MDNRSYDQEEEIIEQKPSQSPQMIDELNFNKRETVTMKQIKQLFEETEPDWERIKNVQGTYIIMLALQNLFSLWILLLLYLMNLGNVIANYIKYPVDLVFIFIYLYCLIQIQFKQHDWGSPPFNYLLYFLDGPCSLKDIVIHICYIQIYIYTLRNSVHNDFT